jgi:MSHA biogenesis protein MshO
MKSQRQSNNGFTLVEMIMVMVITGILGGMVAIFIRAPVQGYVDSSRRAEMVDIADTALRRLARDIRTAVPNSIRVPAAACVATTATPCYVEYLPTKAGGRYRSVTATAGAVLCGSYAAAVLDFATADNCFEILGPPITFVTGDQIVIGSTQSDGNPPYQNPAAAACGVAATTTCIRRAIPAAGAGANRQFVRVTATFPLPAFAEVPGQRFAVVDGTQGAVTYSCDGVGINANGDGTGSLNRYALYGYLPAQQAPATLGAPALLADKLSACTIAYSPFNQRNSLVDITLTITRANESINLSHSIHVNNVP